ncbi:MAG: NADH-quinone oxidoreductase subunit NuoG [Gammaproteobacteria bacterium]
MSDTVNIEINGIPVEVRTGAMVIEAADDAGITIPRFCYHKKLSVAANCRMCLVEVEKAPKPLPACATPVTNGMKVFTRSPLALESQKSVMEFLLINHPLDCPICDQGGECELQDIAVGFGSDSSRYTERKRVVRDKNLGSLIATDMTRCIHCTRCVRFGQEIGGIMELGATGRGEHTEIGTYMERAVSSELSGNVIDLCPVGALTSKPYRYTGRPWENDAHAHVSPHDCIGSNLSIETRRHQVMRVLPRENEALNEVWLSDRDRFSYTALNHKDRLQEPMIKQGSEWKVVDWETALAYAVDGLQRARKVAGAEKLGALVAASATTEEMYLLQKLMRGLGSANIDHRLRQSDFSDESSVPLYPALGCAIAELESRDAVLLIGSNIRKDQPIAGHRLRKASRAGARILCVNPADYAFNFPVEENIVVHPELMGQALAAIAKALLTLTGEAAPEGLAALLENVQPGDAHLTIARHLHTADRASIIIGTQAMSHPHLSTLRALAKVIADLTGASLGSLTEGANSAGAWLAGAIPHRQAAGDKAAAGGQNARDMFAAGLSAYVLLQVEPEQDCANPAAASQALEDADFVISLTPYVTDTMRAYADVLLPIATFAETSGTYVNAEGTWQSFAASASATEDVKPAWKVLRVMGNLLDIAGFDYLSSEDVRDELKNQFETLAPNLKQSWVCPTQLMTKHSPGLTRIGHLAMYSTDMLVRRAAPLQATADAQIDTAIVHSATARQQGVADGDMVSVRQGGDALTIRLAVDDAVPEHCVFLPMGVGGAVLGSAYGTIEISKV